MTRGISQLKYHLAKIFEHEVSICNAVTPKIMRSAHDAIYEKDRKKEVATTNKAEFVASGGARSLGASTTEASGRGSMDSPIGRSSSFFLFHELELEHNLPSS